MIETSTCERCRKELAVVFFENKDKRICKKCEAELNKIAS